MWRDEPDEREHWSGCAAGQTVIGLEADGTVKGCPSLPTVGYAGGNIRDLSLEEIWRSSPEIDFARLRTVDDLWGFCRTCYYADVCRAGCTWTAHSLLGRPGNNPYCHYRALALEGQGLRERIVKTRDAPDRSFAIGEFEVVTEPIPAGADRSRPAIATPGAAGRPGRAGDAPDEGRVPPTLELCRACSWFVWPGQAICPFCGADIAEAAAVYAADLQRQTALVAEVQRLIDKVRRLG